MNWGLPIEWRGGLPSTGKLWEKCDINIKGIKKVLIYTYLPPIPNPMHATSDAKVTKLGAPPAATPKTAAKNSVICHRWWTVSGRRGIICQYP